MQAESYKEQYPLEEYLEIMKPCRVDDRKSSHKTRLDQAMISPLYVAEEKIDGCHYNYMYGRFFSPRISDVTGAPVEKTENLLHLVQALYQLQESHIILDGEIFYPGKKAQDVITITGSHPAVAVAKQKEYGYLHYCVYDILRAPNGKWLLNTPWHQRRKILESLASQIETSGYIRINPAYTEDKRQLLDSILEAGGEGIVLKHVDGFYYPGKRPMWNWIKVKAETEDDAIIIGFEPPKRQYEGKTDLELWPYWARRYPDNEVVVIGKQPDWLWEPVTKYYANGWIGAIVLGKYNSKGQLVKIGTCSGMDESVREDMTRFPDKYLGKVAKIKAMEITRDGAYRHPSFVYIHPDKNPHECKVS
jgi:ATP-dependent DNA ligase